MPSSTSQEATADSRSRLCWTRIGTRAKWQCHSQDCTVWVSRGGNETIDDIESQMLQMGVGDKAAAKHLSKIREMAELQGYTYVALFLDRPFRGEWRVCSWKCHISIAYVAMMSERDMERLRTLLMDTLSAWRQLDAADRPRRLIRCRQFRTQTLDEVGTPGYTMQSVAHLPWDRVQELLDQDRIDSIHVHEKSELPALVRRCWERDRTRLHEARQRAAELPMHGWDPILDMFRCDAGLGGTSLVLEDLLEYLADVVRHFEPAFGRNSKGKLVLPYLTHPSRWHRTKQGDWQQMRRTLLSGLN